MRMTAVSMAAAVILTGMVCAFSMTFVTRVCGRMEALHAEVMDCVGEGRTQAAHEALGRMAQAWRAHEKVMAALVPHDAIHEITFLLIEADACIRSGDMDDFAAGMAQLGEALGHLQEDERLHLSNILRLC